MGKEEEDKVVPFLYQMLLKDHIRCAVLILWLTEVQLTELAELKLARGRASPSSEAFLPEVISPADVQLRNARQEFERFLAHPMFLVCGIIILTVMFITLWQTSSFCLSELT